MDAQVQIPQLPAPPGGRTPPGLPVPRWGSSVEGLTGCPEPGGAWYEMGVCVKMWAHASLCVHEACFQKAPCRLGHLGGWPGLRDPDFYGVELEGPGFP